MGAPGRGFIPTLSERTDALCIASRHETSFSAKYR